MIFSLFENNPKKNGIPPSPKKKNCKDGARACNIKLFQTIFYSFHLSQFDLMVTFYSKMMLPEPSQKRKKIKIKKREILMLLTTSNV